MKYNPFRPNSIVTPGMFQGRYDEILAIQQCLNQAKNENPQHFIVEGERGVGKSSLLLMIQYLAAGKIAVTDKISLNFLVLNVELNSNSDFIDIIRLISSELKNAISRNKDFEIKLKSVWDFLSNWEILGVRYHKEKESQIQPYVILDQLARTLKETIDQIKELDGILILIDESDKPSSSASLGEIVKLLTEKLTKMECDKVLLGLAGLPILNTKLRESHESSPRIFTTITLKPLEHDDRLKVVDAAIEDANKKNENKTIIENDAKELISELSEGYPHFIQEFGSAAFSNDSDNHITVDDVMMGSMKQNGAIDQLGHKYFNEMYFDQINSPEYRKLLQAMATYLDEWVDRAKIKKVNNELKDTTINNAIQALKTRNIILANQNKQGEFRLPTKSFAVWIKAQERMEALKMPKKL